MPLLTLLKRSAGALAATIWQWKNDHVSVISDALAIDDLTLVV